MLHSTFKDVSIFRVGSIKLFVIITKLIKGKIMYKYSRSNVFSCQKTKKKTEKGITPFHHYHDTINKKHINLSYLTRFSLLVENGFMSYLMNQNCLFESCFKAIKLWKCKIIKICTKNHNWIVIMISKLHNWIIIPIMKSKIVESSIFI